MPKESPIPHPSFAEQTSEHLLREELDEGRLKDIFCDYSRIVAGKREVPAQETFYNPRDTRVMESFVEQMATPEGMVSLREKIQQENPNLYCFMQMADIQQRIAEHIISDPKATLEELGEKRRQYLKGEAFGLSVPEGLASAIDLLGRAGYEYYYPDPLLDALFKVDLIARDPETQTYFLIQLKTTPDLDEPFVLSTTQKFLKQESTSHQKPKQDQTSSREQAKLKQDLMILGNYARMLTGRYQEKFIPVYWALPATYSPTHQLYFDQTTGLPKKDFPDILLPRDDESK